MAPRGAFVHKSLRPGKGQSIYSCNREALLVLTAGAALLTGLAIPQGNRWTVNVGLSEGQGNAYKGELEIYAEGLPPGVKCEPVHVSAHRCKFTATNDQGCGSPMTVAPLFAQTTRPVCR